MSKKTIAFGMFLLVALTAVVCVPVTIYLYEPVERNVKFPGNHIRVSGNDGWYESIIGYIHYTEVSNRIESFQTKYDYHVEYDTIHSSDAHYVIQSMLDRLESGGTISLSGHFYLTDTIEISHSYTTFRGGNYTSERTPFLSIIDVSYCVISDTHWYDYELGAYEGWMMSK